GGLRPGAGRAPAPPRRASPGRSPRPAPGATRRAWPAPSHRRGSVPRREAEARSRRSGASLGAWVDRPYNGKVIVPSWAVRRTVGGKLLARRPDGREAMSCVLALIDRKSVV